MAEKILVVGGVALGPKAAARCKRLMPDAQVTLVDENVFISYGGCGIPYYVSGDVSDESELRAPGAFTLDGRQTVTAPVAGRVVRVLCQAGQQVRAGQPLLVLRAMHMENELKAPRDGAVVELLVEAGQTVEVNARLCVVG